MLGTELECPKCGTVAINRDFCACGEYLRWEATLASTEVREHDPPVYVAPEPPTPRVSTLLTLRDPARDADEAGAHVAVAVDPGAFVTVLATLRNQGEIVDTYDLRVEGLPAGWWAVSSPTVFLNPWGTAGDYEQDVAIQLQPPRTAVAEARAWPLTVVARSRTLDADVARVDTVLHIAPFTDTVMRAGPERRHGRRHGRFEVTVFNRGNAPAEIAVEAKHTEARCPVSVAPALATVPVGGAATSLVLAAAPRALFFKRPVDHHVDVSHRVGGVESGPQRVTFRQKPWLPWWLPPVLALAGAFAFVVALAQRDPVVPKLKGDTVAEAIVVLEKRGLMLGKKSYAVAPAGVPVGTVLEQVPAAGDDLVAGEAVHVMLATAAQTGVVPDVNGLTVAAAAERLKGARLGNDPQPAAAGNDWVVIRQDPAPGAKHEVGGKVTLAVEEPASTAAAPAAIPTPEPSPVVPPEIPADAAPSGAPAPSAAAPATPAATPKPVSAKASSKPAKLPADLVFAGATSGQLYRWDGTKAARLTAPKHWFETPAKLEDGYAAVQVTDGARRLVRLSEDGKTIAPIADGDFYRPAYSSVRGLLAVTDGLGRLCVVDPTEEAAPTCTRSGRVSSPAWAPDGRSVLALSGGRLVQFAARGGDASSWRTPKTVYRAKLLRSVAWLDDDRVAVLAADKRGAAHVRVLERFKRAEDHLSHTGVELAASGDGLALRRGAAADDGPMVLLDLGSGKPRVRTLPRGVNPAWAG